MKWSARLGVTELSVLTMSVVLAWPYVDEPLRYEWQALAFGVSLLVVEFFDVELPRGDASTMSMPLVATAALFLSPATAIATVSLATTLALFASLGRSRIGLLPPALARRVSVTLVGLAYVGFFGQGVASGVIGAIGLSATMVGIDFIYAQVQSATRFSTPLVQLLAGSTRLQGTMVSAKVSATVVGVLLFPEMGAWGLLVLTMMLLVMRQAFSLFVSVRRTYQSTIGALARTVEAQSPGKLGHSERAADLATEAARQLGYRGRDVERLAYATLLHDLALLGESESCQEAQVQEKRQSAAGMLAHVSFLSDVVPILQAMDGCGVPDDSDVTREQVLMACIVLVASRTDDTANGEPTEGDSSRLAVLDAVLSDDDRWRIEDAFRRAAVRVRGSLFVLAPRGTGKNGEPR